MYRFKVKKTDNAYYSVKIVKVSIGEKVSVWFFFRR